MDETQQELFTEVGEPVYDDARRKELFTALLVRVMALEEKVKELEGKSTSWLSALQFWK